MPPLTVEDIQDLVLSTLEELGRGRWTDMTSDLQDHIAMRRILNERAVRMQGGKHVQFNAQVRTGQAAKNVGLAATDDVNVVDVLTQGQVPWRHSTTNYAWDRREFNMNNPSAKQIVDLIQVRRNSAWIDLAELMERNFWGKPSDSSDKLTPMGIDYWLVRNTTEGFNGGDPAGFSDGAADLPVSEYPRWQNWTAQYEDVSKTDLVRKMRKAARFCRFRAPVPHPDYNTGDNYGYYTNYNVVGTMEELLEAQNDSLGNDVASKDGQAMFRRRPVEWVPFLEDDEGDPVYGINWGVFHPFFLSGEYLREDPPQKNPFAHTVVEVHVDLTYNFICRDRRRQFIIAK